MAWGWCLKILDELHVWKISDDAKRSPIFFIHVANSIFSGFTGMKPSNICIITSQNLTWINVWKVKLISQIFQSSCSKSNIVQTTSNSPNSTVQQFEQRALWSHTTLGTIKKWREPPKMLILSGNMVEPNNTGNHEKWREPQKNTYFWTENIKEPNNIGNHNKWREPPKMTILSREHPSYNSQTTLRTIKSKGNQPKCWFWLEKQEKHVGAKLHWEP